MFHAVSLMFPHVYFGFLSFVDSLWPSLSDGFWTLVSELFTPKSSPSPSFFGYPKRLGCRNYSSRHCQFFGVEPFDHPGGPYWYSYHILLPDVWLFSSFSVPLPFVPLSPQRQRNPPPMSLWLVCCFKSRMPLVWAKEELCREFKVLYFFLSLSFFLSFFGLNLCRRPFAANTVPIVA